MKTTIFPKMTTLFPTRFAGAGTAMGLGLCLSLLFACCSTAAPPDKRAKAKTTRATSKEKGEAPKDTRPRLQGEEQASVVLQYNSPDYIFMTKPSYRDDGFLRQIRRPDVAGVLDKVNVPRELAVVSLPWQYDEKTLQTILSDWKDLLKQCGFRQVVFVRGTGGTTVKNAVIIETSDLI